MSHLSPFSGANLAYFPNGNLSISLNSLGVVVGIAINSDTFSSLSSCRQAARAELQHTLKINDINYSYTLSGSVTSNSRFQTRDPVYMNT